MKKVGIVRKNEVSFDQLLDLIKSSESIEECGAIVAFIGIVRGISRDKKRIKKLIYEAEKNIAEEVMRNIRQEIIEKYSEVKDVIIYHIIDELNVSDETIYILVSAKHREQAFSAAKEALNRVKKEVPIWKKEVTINGEHWILGDEVVKV